MRIPDIELRLNESSQEGCCGGLDKCKCIPGSCSLPPFGVCLPGSTLSPGAIAGIVLGSLLGLALLAGLVLLCICCLRRFPGRTSVKKQHSLTLAPVLTPPAKKIQSLTSVETSRPLPIKTQMQNPHRAKAQQVISPSPAPGGSPWTVRSATQV